MPSGLFLYLRSEHVYRFTVKIFHLNQSGTSPVYDEHKLGTRLLINEHKFSDYERKFYS